MADSKEEPDVKAPLIDLSREECVNLDEELGKNEAEIQELKQETNNRQRSFIESYNHLKDVVEKCELLNRTVSRLQNHYDTKAKLLNVEKREIDYLHKELGEKNKRIQNMSQEIASKEQTLVELRDHSKATEVKCSALNETISQLQRMLDAKVKILEAEEIAKREIYIKFQEALDSRSKLLDLEKQENTSLREKLDKMHKEMQDLQNEIEAKQVNLDSHRDHDKQFEQKCDMLDTLITNLEKELADKAELLEAKEQDNEHLCKKVERKNKKLREKHEELEDQKTAFHNLLDHSKSMESKCEQLNETITKLKEELETKIIMLESEKKETANLRDELGVKYENIHDLSKKLDEKELNFMTVQDRAKLVGEKLLMANEVITTLNEDLASKTKLLDAEKVDNNYLRQEMNIYHQEMQKLRVEISDGKIALGESRKHVRDVEGKCEMLRSTVRELQANIDSNIKLLDLEKKETIQLQKELSKKENEIQHLRKELAERKLSLLDLSDQERTTDEKCETLSMTIVQLQEMLDNETDLLEAENLENIHLHSNLDAAGEMEDFDEEVEMRILNLQESLKRAIRLKESCEEINETVLKLLKQLKIKKNLLDPKDEKNLQSFDLDSDKDDSEEASDKDDDIVGRLQFLNDSIVKLHEDLEFKTKSLNSEKEINARLREEIEMQNRKIQGLKAEITGVMGKKLEVPPPLKLSPKPTKVHEKRKRITNIFGKKRKG